MLVAKVLYEKPCKPHVTTLVHRLGKLRRRKVAAAAAAVTATAVSCVQRLHHARALGSSTQRLGSVVHLYVIVPLLCPPVRAHIQPANQSVSFPKGRM